jgi:hypothetical protein
MLGEEKWFKGTSCALYIFIIFKEE